MARDQVTMNASRPVPEAQETVARMCCKPSSARDPRGGQDPHERAESDESQLRQELEKVVVCVLVRRGKERAQLRRAELPPSAEVFADPDAEEWRRRDHVQAGLGQLDTQLQSIPR